MTSKIETIRIVKAMQTQTIIQREAVRGLYMLADEPKHAELRSQLSDVGATVQNHIDALQHVLDELAKPDKVDQ